MSGPPEPRSLLAFDGTLLRYRHWPAENPRARLLVVHGLAEHSGRYAELARTVGPLGVSVVAPDLRGHGLSGGRRGHVRSFGEYLQDLETVREHAFPAEPRTGSPLFLLGHSMGGLIVLRYLQVYRPRLRGVALSAPQVGLVHRAPPWMDPVARLLSRLAPALPLPNGIDPDHLSRDAEAVRAYREDPLVHDRVTPRLYTEMLSAMARAREETDRIEAASLLLLLPLADRITDPAAARALVRNLPPGVAVETREYPEGFHEPFHDLQRETALRDLTGWLSGRMA